MMELQQAWKRDWLRVFAAGTERHPSSAEDPGLPWGQGRQDETLRSAHPQRTDLAGAADMTTPVCRRANCNPIRSADCLKPQTELEDDSPLTFQPFQAAELSGRELTGEPS